MEAVKRFFKRLKWETVVSTIVSIVLGIVFIANPTGASDLICKVAGIAMIVVGVLFFVRFFAEGAEEFEALRNGALVLLFGLFFLIKTGTVVSLLALFFGLFLVIDGLDDVREGLEGKRRGARGWQWLFVLAGVVVTLGVLVMFLSFDWVMILLGISLILNGIGDVVAVIWFEEEIKKLAAGQSEEVPVHDEKDFGEMDETV